MVPHPSCRAGRVMLGCWTRRTHAPCGIRISGRVRVAFTEVQDPQSLQATYDWLAAAVAALLGAGLVTLGWRWRWVRLAIGAALVVVLLAVWLHPDAPSPLADALAGIRPLAGQSMHAVI